MNSLEKKTYTHWVVTQKGNSVAHSGLSEKQALSKHQYAGGGRDFEMYIMKSTAPLAPKGRQPRETEAYYYAKDDKLIVVNASIEKVYEVKAGKKVQV